MKPGPAGLVALLALTVIAGAVTATTTAATAATQPGPSAAGYTPDIISYAPHILDLRPTPAPNTRAITVTSDVLFDFGSAALTQPAQLILGQVVAQLKSAPGGTVTVTGYTDDIGTAAYNLVLSAQRARAVVGFLRAQVGRTDLKFVAVGDGEADPVAPNTNPNGSDNPAGRARNRRVVITPPRR